MPNRSPGEGTVFQRQDGRWQAALQVNGTRKIVYGKTRSEVQKKLAALKQQASNGVLPSPGRRTLNDLLAQVFAVSAPNWKPKTLSDYRWLWDCHIREGIGKTKLSRLEPSLLQGLYGELQSQGKHRLAQRVHNLLHRALKLAVLWGWLGENPADRVLRPRYRPERKELWDAWQLHAFLNRTEGHWLQPLWMLLLASGARLGELLALTWDDLSGSAMTIGKTLHRLDGQWVVSEPKTRSGARTVSLPPEAVSAIRKQKAQQNQWRLQAGSEWQDSGLVFTGESGNPLHGSVVAHALRRECDRLQLPRLTPHGLRHLHASLLLQQGLPVPAVSQRLGHANPGITMSIYAHAMKRQDEEAARAIERAMAK